MYETDGDRCAVGVVGASGYIAVYPRSKKFV